jgi:hypothetical protein
MSIGFGSQDMWARLTPKQQVEAMSSENRYYAWQTLGREASWEELVWHYFCHLTPTIITFEVHTIRETIPEQLPQAA